MALRRLQGQWGNSRRIPFPASCSMLRFETQDGESAAVTLTIEPVRTIELIGDPASESEAQAIIEYGSDQGTTHRVVLDCSRGLVITLTGVHFKVDIENIGGGQTEYVPTREWRASASIHATARVTPALVHARLDVLTREQFAPDVFVPNFAFAWTLPRTPQGPMLVSFIGGAGQTLADFRVARDETPRHLVPVGADRVRVQALDDGLTRGRLQFELAL